MGDSGPVNEECTFLLTQKIDSLPRLSQLYIQEIVRVHGVPLSIISDRGLRFTFWFWQSLEAALGIKLCLSTTYHPQIDGQSERLILILEDILRSVVLDSRGSKEPYFPFAESCTITAFWRVLAWLHLRLCTVNCVDPRCVGWWLVREVWLDLAGIDYIGDCSAIRRRLF